ncbi:MAG: alpha/beta fold hydrolase [Lachnoclostridium sp.]|nr:alpha/beta fold hydrolase [Lachnoclostridium sp.]
MLQREYLFEDNHSENLQIPITDVPLAIESDGSLIYGKLTIPAVENENEKVPVLMLLHGYPGHDRNLDLMFTLRRAGIAVVFFSYRGIWGSYGDYCFTHLLEDTKAVFEHLKEHAEEWRLDMDRCYLFGHSMGGFTALNSLAKGLPVKGVITMAPYDLAYIYEDKYEEFKILMDVQKQGYFRVPDENYLERDVEQHHAQWRFINIADSMPEHVPVHFIGGTQDLLAPIKDHIMPIYEKMVEMGRKVTYTEFDDGHSLSMNRVALARLIFDKIAEMEQ